MQDVAIIDFVGIESADIPNLIESHITQAAATVDPKGLIWVACEFDAQDLATTGPFALAEVISATYKWHLQNIIVYPNFARSGQAFAFTDVCEFFLLFVHDPIHRFNKDLVREEHIWQHAEWGKREKNYYPLGKDPGNVWLPTIDDGKGTVTGHVALSLEEIFARCLLLGVPHLNEISEGKTSVRSQIFTRRAINSGEIGEICARTVEEKLAQFQKVATELDQVDARNTLVTTLAEIVELPLGQFAFTVTFNGQNFCLLRTSTEECVGQVPATPQLIEVWGTATGKGSQELRLSKAFNIATAQNQAAKVRDTIEGGWVPHEWDVQISPL